METLLELKKYLWEVQHGELGWEDDYEDIHNQLCVGITEVEKELTELRNFKKSVDEALNSGNGSYRP